LKCQKISLNFNKLAAIHELRINDERVMSEREVICAVAAHQDKSMTEIVLQ
jgi:hypothetical protein